MDSKFLYFQSLRQSNLELRRSNQRANVDRANRTESGLRNLLITLAIFLFTFSSPFITDFTYNIKEIVILVMSWIFLFFSVVFGILQFLVDVRFFEKGAANERRMEELWVHSKNSEDSYNETKEKTDELAVKSPVVTSRIWLYLQLCFSLTGFILSMIIASVILLRNIR